MSLALRLLGFSLLVVGCQGIGANDPWLLGEGDDPGVTYHNIHTTPPPTPPPPTGTTTPAAAVAPEEETVVEDLFPTETTTPEGQWPVGKRVAVGVIGGLGGAAAIALTGVGIHASIASNAKKAIPIPSTTPLFREAAAPAFRMDNGPQFREGNEDDSAGVSSQPSSSTSSGNSSGSWIFWLVLISILCCLGCCIGIGAYFFMNRKKKSRKLKKTVPTEPPVTDTMPLMAPAPAEVGPLTDSRVKIMEPVYTYATPAPVVETVVMPPVYATGYATSPAAVETFAPATVLPTMQLAPEVSLATATPTYTTMAAPATYAPATYAPATYEYAPTTYTTAPTTLTTGGAYYPGVSAPITTYVGGTSPSVFPS